LLLKNPKQAWRWIASEVLEGFDKITIDSLKESFSVAYGKHELTREHIEEVWSFLTDNADGDI
jgi:hypothetical protein